MLKSQIIEVLKTQHPELSKQDLEMVVHLVFDSMSNALASGRGIELRGFGSFKLRDHGPRKVRNPGTGETFDQGPRRQILFRAGDQLKARLNEK